MSKISEHYPKMQVKTSDPNVGKYRREGGKDASVLSFIRRKIGEFERKPNERAPGAHKPNGYLWKRIAGQVARNSLEWAPWGIHKYEIVYHSKNANSSKSNIIENVDGALKICNKYEGFAADPESIRHAKTPYFFECPDN